MECLGGEERKTAEIRSVSVDREIKSDSMVGRKTRRTMFQLKMNSVIERHLLNSFLIERNEAIEVRNK